MSSMQYGLLLLTDKGVRSISSCTRAPLLYRRDNIVRSRRPLHVFILICSKLRVNPEYLFDSMSGFREDMEPLTEDENLEKQLLSLFRSIENKQIKSSINLYFLFVYFSDLF